MYIYMYPFGYPVRLLTVTCVIQVGYYYSTLRFLVISFYRKI